MSNEDDTSTVEIERLFYSASEIAKMLGFTERWTRAQLKTARLPTWKFAKRSRWHRADVDRWVQSFFEVSHPEPGEPLDVDDTPWHGLSADQIPDGISRMFRSQAVAATPPRPPVQRLWAPRRVKDDE